MKDLPIVMKLILNVLIYIIYWVIASLIVGVGMSLFMWNPDNLLADKVWIFLALLILLITLIFREHCYICMRREEKVQEEKKTSYTQTKKQDAVNTKKETVKKKQVDKDDDEIKIYVEKEIK